MKNYIYIISLTMLFYSCATEDSNDAPTVPELVFPVNNQACTDLNLTLDWNPSVDADGDNLTYVVQVSNSASFSQVVMEAVVEESEKMITVTSNAAYYWRVRATDASGASSDFSNIYSFYSETEGIENHVPFAANMLEPSQNEYVSSGVIRLQWQGEDLDENDLLTYDVYIGSSENMLLNEAMNITNDYFDTSLTAGTYYWRIDVKDATGAQSIGQVWRFVVQ